MSVEYEFNEEENSIFSGLVNQSRILGITVLLCGLLYLILAVYYAVEASDTSIGFIFPLIAATVAGVASAVAVSAYLLDAASKFKLVVDTEGKDIEHLLTGLLKFSTIFQAGRLIFLILSLTMAGLLIASKVMGV